MSDTAPDAYGGDDTLPEGCLGALHRYDVDRIDRRFRETDESLGGVRTRVTALEQRMTAVEDRMVEQRAMLVEVRASVRHVDREVSAVHADLADLKDHQRAMVGTLERFTLEQARRAHDRTEAMHRLIRILIGIFALLGVLSVSAASLLALAGERGESLLSLVLSLFGFGS